MLYTARMKSRFHYAWVVIGVTFLVMLVTAGTRATPSVMMVPLERTFGWTRTSISLALALNLALFGLTGPFAAAAMQRFGIRRTVLCALALLALAVALSSRMRAEWQMVLVWGFLVGGATGATSTTLGATVVNRWFTQHRGLAMGVLTASSATGQLAFLPAMAWVAEHHGWRQLVLLVAVAVAITLPIVAMLLPETPQAVGLRRIGEVGDAPKESAQTGINPIMIAVLQDGSEAFVANAGVPATTTSPGIPGSVSIINLNTNTVVATIPGISGSTNESDQYVHGHPNFIAVTTGTPTGKAYVTAGDSTDITILRSDNNTVQTHLSLQGYGVSVRMNQP